MNYKRYIRKRKNVMLFRAGGKEVCVDVRMLMCYMGKIGIWLKIKEHKHQQRLLVPMTKEEALIIGEQLIEFAKRN